MPTDPAWTRLADLVADALERPADDRDIFLADALGSDAGALARARALVAAHAAADASGAFRSPLDAVAEAPAARPARIGPWRVTGLLGEGGMGVVYAAERADGAYERTVAIKRLRPGHGAALRARFEAERRLLAPLEHPGIARLYDAGVDAEGAPYLVMQRVDGLPITDWADAHGLDVPARARLLADVADAVAYAHRHLVVHRDLKPSNVLVRDDGRPVLLDFGVARMLGADDAGAASPLTREHAPLTPAYAAPEQVRGGAVTTATDVYGLGVLAYEVLAGRRPYDLSGATAAEAERLICAAPPPPPSAAALPARARALRGDLDAILQKALDKDPARRYAAADGLAADLRRHLAGLPIEARPPSRARRAGLFVRRHRTVVAATVAVLVTLVGGLVAALGQARIARAEAAKAEAIQEFLGGMLRAADPDADGRDVRVADLLDRAAAALDSTLAGQPAVRADARMRLGQTYFDLGLPDEARTQLYLALALHERLYGGADARTAEVQSSLATVLRDLADYRRADSLYGLALATMTRVHGARSPEAAQVLAERGTLAYQQGDVAMAADAYRRALAIEEATLPPGDPEIAISMSNLAAALAGLDSTEAALRLSERVAALHRARGDRAGLAATLPNLGALYARMERYDDAARVQRDAVRLSRETAGANHPYTAFGLSNYGSTLVSLGRPADAERVLRESVRIYRAALGEAHPDAGYPLVGLARALRDQGRLDEAEATAREAGRLFRAGFGPDHWALERVDETLASIAAARP